VRGTRDRCARLDRVRASSGSLCERAAEHAVDSLLCSIPTPLADALKSSVKYAGKTLDKILPVSLVALRRDERTVLGVPDLLETCRTLWLVRDWLSVCSSDGASCASTRPAPVELMKEGRTDASARCAHSLRRVLPGSARLHPPPPSRRRRRARRLRDHVFRPKASVLPGRAPTQERQGRRGVDRALRDAHRRAPRLPLGLDCRLCVPRLPRLYLLELS